MPDRNAPIGGRPQLFAGYFWAALTLCIFAGWFVVSRLGMSHALRAWDITALRFGGGILFLFPVLLRSLPPGAWRTGALFALLWGAPFVVLVAFGVQLTSAGLAAAITPTLMPVLSGLIGWALLGEIPGGRRMLGYAAIVTGQIGLTVAAALVTGPPNPIGLLALIAASALWSLYTLLFRGSGLTSVQSAALICFWSALAYLPAYAVSGVSQLPRAEWGEIAFQAGYQGLLMTAVGIVTFNRAVTLLGAGAASAIIALLPAAAAAIAIPVLGEVPGPLEAAAIAVIAGGVLLAAVRSAK